MKKFPTIKIMFDEHMNELKSEIDILKRHLGLINENPKNSLNKPNLSNYTEKLENFESELEEFETAISILTGKKLVTIPDNEAIEFTNEMTQKSFVGYLDDEAELNG